MTAPEPRPSVSPHVHESVGVYSRGPCEAPRVTVCSCGATKREGFNWTQPPGPHSFDTLPAEQRAELQLFAEWLKLPKPKVPFETYRAEHLPKPDADLSASPLPGEWARDPVAEEPPPPELREAALRWLRIIASPVPGAAYISPAVSQADNAKTILAHVASLSSQLKRRKDGEIALLSEWADERAGLLATIAEDTESLERLKAEQTDAQIVARFIVGWWPGLEDALYWPKDADEPESNKVYAAAKRILGRQSDTGAQP